MSLKVVELFAGVGGFRLGLEKNRKYKVVWSNQWEPLTKTQHASMVYKERFKTSKEEHSDQDIFTIETKDIPNHDLLVPTVSLPRMLVIGNAAHAADLIKQLVFRHLKQLLAAHIH
mgnify:CR=1 FL=1